MKKININVSLAVIVFSASACVAQDFKLSDEYLRLSISVQSLYTLDTDTALSDQEPPSVPTPAHFTDVNPNVPADGPVYDPEKGEALSKAAGNGNIGAFTKKCYEYVAYHMQDAGVITRQGWFDLGIEPKYAARASDFVEWTEQYPELMRNSLKLVRIPTPASKYEVPIGSIIAYEKGACGFSSKSGHIEIVVTPDWACSDGCENLDQSCFSDPDERERMHVLMPVKV